MNIQAMMQQAQKLQKDIANAKKEIEEKTFNVKKNFVEIEVSGKKEILKIKIDNSIEKDDIEILEDLLLVGLNEVFSQIDKETEEKLGKFGPGLNGLI